MNEKMDALNEKNRIVAILDEHKADDIVSVEVGEFNPFASYVVIATCLNPRALGAMKDILAEELEKDQIEISVSEGEPDSGWVIVATEEVIIHLLLAANRRELDLETLLDQLAHRIGKA